MVNPLRTLARAVVDGNRRAAEQHAWLRGEKTLMVVGDYHFVIDEPIDRMSQVLTHALRNRTLINLGPTISVNPHQVTYLINRPHL